VIVGALNGAENMGTVVLVMALIGKMCIAAAFAAIYNYSAEIFPTVARQSFDRHSAISVWCMTI
jgi:hypothetical protein